MPVPEIRESHAWAKVQKGIREDGGKTEMTAKMHIEEKECFAMVG